MRYEAKIYLKAAAKFTQEAGKAHRYSVQSGLGRRLTRKRQVHARSCGFGVYRCRAQSGRSPWASLLGGTREGVQEGA